MKRLLLSLLMLAGLPACALGQGGVVQSKAITPGHVATWLKNGVINDGGPLPSPTAVVPMLVATNYGVLANGVASDDKALKAAVDACAALGASLWLPPGKILLTGAATITLKNCGIFGSNIPAGGTTTASLGTVIEITSTSVKPFVCQSDWSITGVSFYWPSQTTGSTPYQPLITDDGTNSCSHVSLDNVTVVNAYDGFVQTAAAGWGDWIVSNSRMFAAHDLWSLGITGDGFSFTNMRFLPGAWLSMGGSNSAVGTAANSQKVFHITNGSGVNLTMTNIVMVGARYAFYLDASATLAESQINATYDAVGTIVDTSSGGLWAPGIQMTGAGACGTPPTTWGSAIIGNAPCFNLGASGEFKLSGFISNGSQGSLIVSSGTNLYIDDVKSANIGSAQDGGDYYQVNATAAVGAVSVKNSRFVGINGSAHTHGLHTALAATQFTSIGNEFTFSTDAITIQAAVSETMIANNWSLSTQGAVSITISGTNPVWYRTNNFDKPPVATVSNCGAGAAVSGDFSGYITVGSTNPTTSCKLTLPWIAFGTTASFIDSNAIALGAQPSSNFWTIGSAADVHSTTIFYAVGAQ